MLKNYNQLLYGCFLGIYKTFQKAGKKEINFLNGCSFRFEWWIHLNENDMLKYGKVLVLPSLMIIYTFAMMHDKLSWKTVPALFVYCYFYGSQCRVCKLIYVFEYRTGPIVGIKSMSIYRIVLLLFSISLNFLLLNDDILCVYWIHCFINENESFRDNSIMMYHF